MLQGCNTLCFCYLVALLRCTHASLLLFATNSTAPSTKNAAVSRAFVAKQPLAAATLDEFTTETEAGVMRAPLGLEWDNVSTQVRCVACVVVVVVGANRAKFAHPFFDLKHKFC